MNKQEAVRRLSGVIEYLSKWDDDESVHRKAAYENALCTVELIDDAPFEKPIIPPYVEEFIKKMEKSISRHSFNIEQAINSSDNKDLAEWLGSNKNVEKLFKAMEVGYEVDREKRFEVIIGGQYLVKVSTDRNDYVMVPSEELFSWFKSGYQLTKKEIEDIDPRFLPFAEPVVTTIRL
ncbi:hypothetical protein EH802P2_00095 [Enterococcus phage EH802P2]|nr:hypothetical protein EH802P1_00004 [Enterococcus phage EH802P1]WAX16200.1 hypothetical protein EH802P2_00095 [Enterococcus phage EH802P2]